MRRTIMRRSSCAAALLVLLAAPAASAAEIAVFMKNGQSRAVVLELQSQSREKMWPGDDQVWMLEAGERKSAPVTCEAGETICYAAWAYGDDRISWGVGPDGDRKCDDCCFTCVEKWTETIDLAP